MWERECGAGDSFIAIFEKYGLVHSLKLRLLIGGKPVRHRVLEEGPQSSLQDTDINDALGDGGATRWKEPGYQDGESCPTELNIRPELLGELEINFYDMKLLSLGHLFVTLA